MRASNAILQDWRDGAAYQPLLGADRTLFAWEWLRRDPLYASAAAGELGAGVEAGRPEPFGLLAFEPPHLGVPAARPLWRREACPLVLAVEAGAGAAERFDPASFPGLARIVMTGEGEHLLLSDGLRQLRLDAPAGLFSGGPARLRFTIEGLASAERPLLTLRRFLVLCRTGTFSPALHRPEVRARRWILMLRVHDALAAGASQREIAHELLSASAGAPQWRVRESSIRSQVQRLVRSSRQMASGAYRQLLG